MMGSSCWRNILKRASRLIGEVAAMFKRESLTWSGEQLLKSMFKGRVSPYRENNFYIPCLKGKSHLIRGVRDVCTGEYPVCGRSGVLEVHVRMKSVLKGESHLIVEVDDVCAGEVPIGGHRGVLQVHSENEECFKGRVSPDWGSPWCLRWWIPCLWTKRCTGGACENEECFKGRVTWLLKSMMSALVKSLSVDEAVYWRCIVSSQWRVF